MLGRLVFDDVHDLLVDSRGLHAVHERQRVLRQFVLVILAQGIKGGAVAQLQAADRAG